MNRLIAICLLLATVTEAQHGNRCWCGSLALAVAQPGTRCLCGSPALAALATTTTPAPGFNTYVPIPRLRIPPGYTYVPETESMYKFHENGASWDDAVATCQREGGHLVVLNDAVEAAAVTNIMKKAGYRHTWIGLRDRRPGGEIDWRAVSGEPVSAVYNWWDSGRPYKTGDWTCAYLFDNKLLYDSPCYVPNYFTCEISQW